MKYEVEFKYYMLCKQKVVVEASSAKEAIDVAMNKSGKYKDQYKTVHISEPAPSYVNKIEFQNGNKNTF